MTSPITDDELADFVAWLDRSVEYLSKMRGTREPIKYRRHLLLEELRQRAFAKKPVQMEFFP